MCFCKVIYGGWKVKVICDHFTWWLRDFFMRLPNQRINFPSIFENTKNSIYYCVGGKEQIEEEIIVMRDKLTEYILWLECVFFSSFWKLLPSLRMCYTSNRLTNAKWLPWARVTIPHLRFEEGIRRWNVFSKVMNFGCEDLFCQSNCCFRRRRRSSSLPSNQSHKTQPF
jgi:hypothetical protein